MSVVGGFERNFCRICAIFSFPIHIIWLCTQFEMGLWTEVMIVIKKVLATNYRSSVDNILFYSNFYFTGRWSFTPFTHINCSCRIFIARIKRLLNAFKPYNSLLYEFYCLAYVFRSYNCFGKLCLSIFRRWRLLLEYRDSSYGRPEFDSHLAH